MFFTYHFCFLLITYDLYSFVSSSTYPFQLLLITYAVYLSLFLNLSQLIAFLKLIIAYYFYANKRLLDAVATSLTNQPTRTGGCDAVGVVSTTRDLFIVMFVW